MAEEENPYAKYVTAPVAEENPYAKYVVGGAPPASTDGLSEGFRRLGESITADRPEVTPNPASLIGLLRAGIRGQADLRAAVERGASPTEMAPSAFEAAQFFSPYPVASQLAKSAGGRMAGIIERSAGEYAKAVSERVVAPEEAGAIIRRVMDFAPDNIRGLSGAKDDTALLDRFVNMATSKNEDDIRVLNRIRGSVPREQWQLIQSGALQRIADEGVGGAGYADLTKAGKNALFPQEIIPHLDAMAASAKRGAEAAATAEKEGFVKGWMKDPRLAAVVGGMAAMEPVTVISALVGVPIAAKILQTGGKAAAAASFVAARETYLRRPTSATLGSLNMAINNFNRNADTNVSLQDMIDKGLVPSPDKMESMAPSIADRVRDFVRIPGFIEAQFNPMAAPQAPPSFVGPRQPGTLSDEDIARIRGRTLGAGML